jgi:hypothetical protein
VCGFSRPLTAKASKERCARYTRDECEPWPTVNGTEELASSQLALGNTYDPLTDDSISRCLNCLTETRSAAEEEQREFHSGTPDYEAEQRKRE